MNTETLQLEIKQMFESTAKEIKDRDERIATEQRVLADRMLLLEQKGGLPPPLETKAGPTLGEQVFEGLQKNADHFSRSKSLRLELKAATDVVTTASGRRVVTGDVGSPSAIVLGLQNAFPTRPGGGTTAIEYSRYTGVQGAAAVQAGEGAAKAPMRVDHSLIAQGAITIAGFTKISRQALNDRAELAASVNVTLLRSVNKALDTALAAGSATPVFTGLLALATLYTSLAYTPMPDAISESVATMQLAGFAPDVVALNPADWLAAVVARGTLNDAYLSGNYLAALPEAMRGLRVVLSAGVTAGKALLLDSAQLDLVVVDGFAVEVGYDGDDFTKNIATLLGETRVIPIFRSVGAAMLVTPKAP